MTDQVNENVKRVCECMECGTDLSYEEFLRGDITVLKIEPCPDCGDETFNGGYESGYDQAITDTKEDLKGKETPVCHEEKE